ncbi:hypothetical protein [Austwickia sp. TVS 96-490-7B]|nr:hypothetical protein [Austwickia sp. TVS 96-490-7B]
MSAPTIVKLRGGGALTPRDLASDKAALLAQRTRQPIPTRPE